jgi:hypothetical protein
VAKGLQNNSNQNNLPAEDKNEAQGMGRRLYIRLGILALLLIFLVAGFLIIRKKNRKH